MEALKLRELEVWFILLAIWKLWLRQLFWTILGGQSAKTTYRSLPTKGLDVEVKSHVYLLTSPWTEGTLSTKPVKNAQRCLAGSASVVRFSEQKASQSQNACQLNSNKLIFQFYWQYHLQTSKPELTKPVPFLLWCSQPTTSQDVQRSDFYNNGQKSGLDDPTKHSCVVISWLY